MSRQALIEKLQATTEQLEHANRELAAREARLRLVVENEPECVKVVGRDGRLMELNPAGLAMLEVGSLVEAQQSPLTDFLLPEYRKDFEALHRLVLRGGSGTLEFEIEGRLGTRRWLETHAVPLRDTEGRIESLIGITRDLTARKAEEAASRVRMYQQGAATGLAQLAMTAGLPLLFEETARALAEALEVPLCMVLELQPGGGALRLVAGTGCQRGLVGGAEVGAGGESLAGYTLRSDVPVTVDDLSAEPRFVVPPLLTQHGAVSGLTVALSDAHGPWGVLAVCSREPRRFLPDEVRFVSTISAVLGSAIQRDAAEQAMRASEAQFRAICEASPVGIFLARPDGHVTYGNPADLRMRGQVWADAKDQDWAQAIHPDDRVRVMAEWQAAHSAGRPFAGTGRYLQPDGTVVWWDATTAPVWDGNTILGNVGVVVNVTERREAELRLRQLNRTYAVLSSINQLIVREREPQTILEGACRIAVETGGFRLAWIGLEDGSAARLKSCAQAGGPPHNRSGLDGRLDDAPFDRMTALEALDSGGQVVCNDLEADPRAADRYEHARAAGARAVAALPLRVSGRSFGVLILHAGQTGFFDAAELRLLDELSRDIAFALEGCERERERQRALDELRAGEERFRQLAETIQEVFWVTDPEKNRLHYVSPAYEVIFGRTCESLHASPRSWIDAVHPEDRERVSRAAMTRQIQGEYDEEYRIVRPDEEIRWIRDRAFPARNAAGQIERIVGVARDITDRKAAEEQMRQAQKMESVGMLAAGIAHDFNNVLTVVNGVSELALADLAEGDPLRDDLASIRDAGTRAAELTRQLLAFSRKQVLRSAVADLNALVVEAETLLRRVLGERITVVVRLAPDLARVIIDQVQLHQVILNLAVNSRDAMPSGGTLTIETRNVILGEGGHEKHHGMHAGRYVLLAVGDTGVGMDAATRRRLFEPFFTTKGPGKGTGLGLATVHGIVKQSGGEVHVDTGVGQGTTFRIYLPCAERGDGVQPHGGHPAGAGGAESILVVDDDPAVRSLTRRMLERGGYVVHVAAGADEALELFARHEQSIQLVLTDVVMPGMDGRELSELLRQRRPLIKILFVSGHTEDVFVRGSGAGTGAHLISKPYSASELTAKVREVLDTDVAGR